MAPEGLRPAILVVVAALACGGPGEDLEPWRLRGAETLRPFKANLQAALAAGLESGPADALEVCRVHAPGLAATASSPGVRVGRTSHKLRNPDNAPAPWMEPLLAAYRADPTHAESRVVSLAGGGVAYVEPIRMQPLCLTCHGETLAPDVAERIAALYPDDQATGFRVGELRGLFWVEFR